MISVHKSGWDVTGSDVKMAWCHNFNNHRVIMDVKKVKEVELNTETN